MTGHRKWAQVRSSGPSGPSPDQRVAARTEIDAEIANYQLTLAQLRQAKNLTQVALAEGLGVTQSQVSRLENQADLYLSSLRGYVRQLGGDLQLRAVFGN
jgi:DNA-binding XRE family transcriptional regulator